MEEPLRIALCEDTAKEAEKLTDILNRSDMPNKYTLYESGEALLENYQMQKFDLLLMDIIMGGMTGVETVKKIRQIDRETPLAFITTSTEHTLESYRLSALKYIEKPYEEADIKEILTLAKMKKDNAPCLLIQKNGKMEKIRISGILYLEQQARQVFICLEGGKVIEVYEKLQNLLPQLEEQPFFHPHKSFTVNLTFVEYIDNELRCFHMQNGKNVPIRRETLGKAKKALETYLFDRTRGIHLPLNGRISASALLPFRQSPKLLMEMQISGQRKASFFPPFI